MGSFCPERASGETVRPQLGLTVIKSDLGTNEKSRRQPCVTTAWTVQTRPAPRNPRPRQVPLPPPS